MDLMTGTGTGRTPASGQRTGGSTGSSSLGVGRRILRTRGFPVAVALLLAAFAYAGLAGYQTSRLHRIPGDGLVVDGDTVVSADSRWPGLAPGDRIVEVAGTEMHLVTVPHRMTEVPVSGETATLTVVRGGGGDAATRFRVPAPIAPLPPIHTIGVWVRFMVGCLTLLLGVVGFVLRPGSRVGWLFLTFCLTFSTMILFPLALAPWLSLFPTVQGITFALNTAIGVHTFCELPRRLALVERHPWLPGLLYVPSVAISVAALLAPDSYLPATVAGLYALIGCAAVLALLATGLARARRDAQDRVHAQYRVLLIGVTLGLFIPIVIEVARTAADFGAKWFVHFNAIPTVIYPAVIAYALLRRNVLGADRFTAVVVSYGAALALAGAGCGALLIGVPLVLYGKADVSPMALAIVSAAGALSIAPLYRVAKRLVDRRFQRSSTPAAQLAVGLREVARLVAANDRDAALTRVFVALRALGSDEAALYVADPSGRSLVRERAIGSWAPGTRSVIEVDGPLGRALAIDTAAGVAAFAESTLPDDAQDALWSVGMALCAAVPAGGTVAGMLALGPRASGERYGVIEQDQLVLLAAQVGILLERARSGGQLGRYRIERRLGVGGMAEVHLAWQSGPGGFERRVALKQPLPHITEDPALLAAFLDEARLASSVQHPCIAQILEVGRDGSSYFMAMEYVDGLSLRALLRAIKEPVPLDRALAVMDSLLRALECAHRATDAHGHLLKLVHRDVTPANLLVSSDGDVKLVDFGIALAATRLQVTRVGAVKGTAAYMSPEQRAGKDVDHRSDVFGAGLLLFEMLATHRPWPDGAPVVPATPPTLPIPDPVYRVICRALSWPPADRFASAEDMRVALVDACRPTAAAEHHDLARWIVDARIESARAAAAADSPPPPTATRTADAVRSS